MRVLIASSQSSNAAGIPVNAFVTHLTTRLLDPGDALGSAFRR
jgi:hypothetical protein